MLKDFSAADWSTHTLAPMRSTRHCIPNPNPLDGPMPLDRLAAIMSPPRNGPLSGGLPKVENFPNLSEF